jgi:hypothetical protein
MQIPNTLFDSLASVSSERESVNDTDLDYGEYRANPAAI